MDNSKVQMIRQNLEAIQERVTAASIKAGGKPEDVKIVVVTKAQDLETTQAAILAGAKILGENYPEETVGKIHGLQETTGVEWHMIGHLQSRKAKLVVDYFQMMHSLDSLKLAGRLNRMCKEKNIRLPVLLEFNISGEESKWGWSAWDEDLWEQPLPEIKRCVELSNLEIRGVMAMPPWHENPEKTRPYFIKLRKFRDYLSRNIPEVDFRELSMGTSVDFEVAVEEGATFIRVGEAILGKRQAK